MPLSDTTLRKTKPREANYKISDGQGLYIEITTAGSKLWRINYRFQGKQRTYREFDAPYPHVSLLEARTELEWAKQQLRQGKDPVEEKRKLRQTADDMEAHEKKTFRYVAEQWLEAYKRKVLEKQISKIKQNLQEYLYPALGGKLVTEIKAIDILNAARKKEDEGKHHTAHRLVSLCGQVLDHARLMGLIEYNIARGGLTRELLPVKTKHYAALINPAEIGELLCDIDEYTGYSDVIPYYLRLIPYVFTRPTELRKAQWPEFDFEQKLWIVPVDRMKTRQEAHKVPLSEQVIRLLKELHTISGKGQFLFPSARARTRTLSDVGVLAALRRMGYDKEAMTVHGFRTIASTLLNERGYNTNHIEKQLSHKDDNEVRAAYNRAEYIEQRRTLMQDWADILDQLRYEAKARRANLRESRTVRVRELEHRNQAVA